MRGGKLVERRGSALLAVPPRQQGGRGVGETGEMAEDGGKGVAETRQPWAATGATGAGASGKCACESDHQVWTTASSAENGARVTLLVDRQVEVARVARAREAQEEYVEVYVQGTKKCPKQRCPKAPSRGKAMAL